MRNGKADRESPIARLLSPEGQRGTVLALFATAVVARFIFYLVVRPLLGLGTENVDYWPDEFDEFAENLLGGEGFAIFPGAPSVMRGPVYPLLGAATFFVFGMKNPVGVHVVHAALDGLTAVLLYRIGRKIFGHRVGLVAGLLFALYPISIWHSAKMEMVSLLTLLYVWTCWWVLKSFDSLSVKISLAIGLLLGVTTLTLPITPLLPLFLLVAWLIRHPKRYRVVGHTLLVSGVMVLVVAPWTIRNYRVSGHFVPVSAGGGYAVMLGDLMAERFDGFSPYSDEYPALRHIIVNIQDPKVLALCEREGVSIEFPHTDITADASRVLNKYALGSIAERPLRFVRKVCIQFWTFWYLGVDARKTLVILLTQVIFLLPWLLAGLFWCAKMRVVAAVPVLLLIFYFNLTYAATVSVARHGAPAMALALVVSAYGICEIAARIRARGREAVAANH